MDVYGDNEVNDLKELWETDLDVSGKKILLFLFILRRNHTFNSSSDFMSSSFLRTWVFDVIIRCPYLTFGEKEFPSVT